MEGRDHSLTVELSREYILNMLATGSSIC